MVDRCFPGDYILPPAAGWQGSFKCWLRKPRLHFCLFAMIQAGHGSSSASRAWTGDSSRRGRKSLCIETGVKEEDGGPPLPSATIRWHTVISASLLSRPTDACILLSIWSVPYLNHTAVPAPGLSPVQRSAESANTPDRTASRYVKPVSFLSSGLVSSDGEFHTCTQWMRTPKRQFKSHVFPTQGS